ncbi:hypothetical protein VPH35_005539 [Triticum aestivum]
MASAGAGRGGGRGFGNRGGFRCCCGVDARGGFFARKRQNDDEAGGSGLRSPASKKQGEVACTRGAKSRSAGPTSRAWKTFRRCGRLFDSAIQRQWEAEWAWFEARTAADAEDVVAVVRLLTLWDEYQLQTRIYRDLIYDTIHEGKPLPAEVISSDDNDEGDNSDSNE